MTPPTDTVALKAGDALVIADLQNDFLPGGALGVLGGDEVVPVINEYLRRFSRQGLPVYVTRDWHPAGHCSFRSEGGPWPTHCIAGTPGAAFAADLSLPVGTTVISKATDAAREAYSAFAGTDLDEQMRRIGVRRVFVGGLATDYCVLDTVKDALALGYSTLVLLDAVRAVNVKPTDGEDALAQMRTLGAVTVSLESIR
ncbi:MAG: isochorismatase family protein [Ramlibacter sp.]